MRIDTTRKSQFCACRGVASAGVSRRQVSGHYSSEVFSELAIG